VWLEHSPNHVVYRKMRREEAKGLDWVPHKSHAYTPSLCAKVQVNKAKG